MSVRGRRRRSAAPRCVDEPLMELHQRFKTIQAGEVGGACLTVSNHVATPGATCRLFAVSISLSWVVCLIYGEMW
jgi:hypothetical protein